MLTRKDGPGTAKGRHVPPHYWPLVIDLVARQCVLMSKSGARPEDRLSRSLMESAIAMSKVDPKTVPQVMPAPAKAYGVRAGQRAMPQIGSRQLRNQPL